ncbi:MAG: hypothetical protein B7Z80_04705, partial [Rhodospirillales bacterium 20-64-7]
MGARNRAEPSGLALTKLRRRAARALWAERLGHALIPAAAILWLYVILGLFGLAGGWRLLAAAGTAMAALVWELARLRRPRMAEIDRRIEAASGLSHQPLATLTDRPAQASAAGAAIWQAHQARTQALLAQARAGWPAPQLGRRDPFGLAGLLLALLATGWVIAGPDAPARLRTAFAPPAWPFPGPALTVWVTPPAYAGTAPIALPKSGTVQVLAGSQLSVILNGSTDAIVWNGAKLPAQALGRNGRRADRTLSASGILRVGPWWHRVAQLRITVTPPAAPQLSWRGPGAALEDGKVRLSWQTGDAYGLARLTAAIHPEGYPQALPEGAELPTQRGDGDARLDTADSPYSGMAVAITLQARNLAGVAAKSDPRPITLPPGPALHDPTAIVLGIARQNLALTPEQAPAIAAQLMHLAAAPPSAISYGADTELAGLAAALHSQRAGPSAVVAELLKLIREIEAGPDFRPAQALARADQALLQALSHGAPDKAALNRLLAQMHQALAQHLNALGAPPNGNLPGRHFDISGLDRLAQQIAADERAGRTEQAQAELKQLQSALQALQHARPMSPAEAARAQQEGQAAQAIGQVLQDQARLRDQTAQGAATASQQGALKRRLDGAGRQLHQAGMQNLPGMADAARQMDQAKAALAQQDDGPAHDAQTKAIGALQKAAAALQRAMQQTMSVMGGAPAQDGQPDGSGEDLDNSDVALPGQNAAGAIQQKIIHLDADPKLPAATHDY